MTGPAMALSNSSVARRYYIPSRLILNHQNLRVKRKDRKWQTTTTRTQEEWAA